MEIRTMILQMPTLLLFLIPIEIKEYIFERFFYQIKYQLAMQKRIE